MFLYFQYLSSIWFLEAGVGVVVELLGWLPVGREFPSLETLQVYVCVRVRMCVCLCMYECV